MGFLRIAMAQASRLLRSLPVPAVTRTLSSLPIEEVLAALSPNAPAELAAAISSGCCTHYYVAEFHCGSGGCGTGRCCYQIVSPECSIDRYGCLDDVVDVMVALQWENSVGVGQNGLPQTFAANPPYMNWITNDTAERTYLNEASNC